MPAQRWNPPAFLLPAWSEPRLAIVRCASPSAAQKSSTAPFHCSSSKREQQTKAPRRRPAEVAPNPKTAVFHIQDPFPERNDDGSLSDRSKPRPTAIGRTASGTIFRRVNSDGEAAEQTQNKAYAILRARQTLGLQQVKRRRDTKVTAGKQDANGARQVEGKSKAGPYSSRLMDSGSRTSKPYYTGQPSIFAAQKGNVYVPLNQKHAIESRRSVNPADATGDASLAQDSETPKPRLALWKELNLFSGSALPAGSFPTAKDDNAAYTHNEDPTVPTSKAMKMSGTLSTSLPAATSFRIPKYLPNTVTSSSQARDEKKLLDISWLQEQFDDVSDVDEPEELAVIGDIRTRSPPLGKGAAVLVIRTHDRTLEAEDFLRLAPRGRHVSSWQDHGRPLRVVPGRSLKSLERLNYYALTFRCLEDLESYVSHVEGMHRVAIVTDEKPLEILPGKFLDIPIFEGMNIETLKENYSLATEGERLSMQIFTDGVPPNLNELLRRKTTRSQVLFWLDGYRPDQADIKKVLEEDGQARGVSWSAINRMYRYDPTRTSIGTELPAPDEESGETEVDEIFHKNSLSRWMLHFDTETEAQRFIRAWHMTCWPQDWSSRRHRDPGEAGDGSEIIVHASLLW